MELINWDGLSLGSIIAGIIPTPLLYFFGILFRWCARNKIVGRFFFSARTSFLTRTLILMLLAFGVGYATSYLVLKFSGAIVSGLVSGTTFFLICILCIQAVLAKVGVHSAELSVATGTDYTTSLNLCRNYFWFLGTGASKLTASPSFNDTIVRCGHAAHQIRFLLAAPDNTIIGNAELRADATPGAYKHNLIRSLKVLSELRKERAINFEVRFYAGVTDRDFENFRMFFVDDDVLLLSYNVYGRGDGRQTPQLVIRKGFVTGESDGFYHAYRSYYERLWSSSRVWDFEEFL